MQQLLIGIVMVIGSVGTLLICRPRNGKKAWFVGVPFLASGIPIIIIGCFVIGLVLVAAYFTPIDDLTLSGARL